MADPTYDVSLLKPTLLFDGSSGQVLLPTFPASVSGAPGLLGGPITIELWLKVNSGRIQSAFTLTNLDNPNRAQAHVPNSDNVLYWDYGDSGVGGRVSAAYASYLGAWTHVALVSTGSGGAYKAIYLNGVLATSASAPGAPGSQAANAYLGASPGIGSYHLGDITDFRVWNAARSAQQISDNMFRRLKGNETGLVAFYPIEENSGSLIFDAASAKVGSMSVFGVSWEPPSARRPISIGSDAIAGTIARQISTLFRSPQTARADFSFDNYNSQYSPENSNSPYAGQLKPGVGFRVQATYGGSLYSLFTGNVDRYDVEPAFSRRATRIQASDRFKDLLRRRIDTAIVTNIPVGSLVANVLSVAGVAVVDQVIDTSADLQTQIPFAWFQNYEVQRALLDIQRFGYFPVFVAGNGKVNFRSRYLGIGAVALGSYVNDFEKLQYSLDDVTVINDTRISGQPRKTSTSVNTIGWLTEVPFVAGSGAVSFTLQFQDPATQERNTPATSVSVTQSADYLINTSSDGTGVDLTATASVQLIIFGASAVCSLFNGDGRYGYLTKFQLRGYAAQRQPQIVQAVTDNSSQVTYGTRAYALASDFVGREGYALDYASFLTRSFKDPIQLVDISVKNVWPDNLARELGDTIYIAESNAAVGSLFTVAGIDHEISLGKGLEHLTTFRCAIYNVPPWLVLDDATLGKLDSGRQLAF